MRSQPDKSPDAILVVLRAIGPMSLDDVVKALCGPARPKPLGWFSGRRERGVRRQVFAQLRPDGPLVRQGLVSVALGGQYIISAKGERRVFEGAAAVGPGSGQRRGAGRRLDGARAGAWTPADDAATTAVASADGATARALAPVDDATARALAPTEDATARALAPTEDATARALAPTEDATARVLSVEASQGQAALGATPAGAVLATAAAALATAVEGAAPALRGLTAIGPVTPLAADPAPPGAPVRRRWALPTRVKRVAIGAVLALATAVALQVSREISSSSLQSRYFADKASDLGYWVGDGASDAIAFPADGPYDQRLGYSLIPSILERITKQGYRVTAQARLSPLHLSLVQRGIIYPIYREKPQAGLTILDAKGMPLFTSRYPQLIYGSFGAIPAPIVQTLLFIEDRNLLDPSRPYKNPTLEWGRLLRAVSDNLIAKVVPGHESPGGSTLATQIEKYRHSPDGRTASVRQKVVQMVSATLRSYQDGPETLPARERVVTDYINSVPLGAVPGGGEIRGLGQGLVAWHGASFARVNYLLSDIATPVRDPELLKAKALAYKEMLSLFLAQRRPAYYLQANREALKALVDKHLRLLATAGLLTPAFRVAVAKAELTFRNNNLTFQPERQAFVERKAANAVRVHLLSQFGFDRLYSLDRLDLKVTSTIDYDTQRDVSRLLGKLKDRGFAAANGLMDNRLLAKGDPAEVIYSFTLREHVGNANLLRVQADNVDGPFNVSEGGKLELGSTAKLRTLVTYLEVVEELFRAYGGRDPAIFAKVKLHPTDRLSAWALSWLAQTPKAGRTLQAMLDAAMDREYSASPAEVFFTGGGAHRFNNFEAKDNVRVVPVREALRKSINLPFIRIMRDVVGYFAGQLPHATAMLAAAGDPERHEYLVRFANKEGREFLGHFYLRYRGMTGDQALEALLAKTRKSLRHLGAIHSVLRPGEDAAAFAAFVRAHAPELAPTPRALATVHAEMRSPQLTLQDKGYLAGVHPLELWLVGYLTRDAAASFSRIMDASALARQESYKWLFNSHDKLKQDKRIKIMLEQEAFQAIHQRWHRLGYPFATLVPSYATAIGSSGDKPTALADLMSIIVSGGVRYANARVSEMDFALGTPFETRVGSAFDDGTRVLSAEIAGTVRAAIREVVENGTAQRIKGTFLKADGTPLAVGGKTGTGDNRYSIYAPGGHVIESKVMSRTATFVFYLGDRFFGTLTAYVPNGDAKNFNFTSALPVQILKVLAPSLAPLLAQSASAAH